MRIISVINTGFTHRTKERSLQRTPMQIMAVAFAASALAFGVIAFAAGGACPMYRRHLPRQSPTPRARTLTPHGMLTESRCKL